MISLRANKFNFTFIIKNQRTGHIHDQLHQLGIALHHVVILQDIPHQIAVFHHLVFHVFRCLIQHLIHLATYSATLS
ncbi:hypothetical protein EC3234A_201c00010 [Escherichia coli]|nr:hypothetical protein EC3234A_201c00010 [Escherichia coli]